MILVPTGLLGLQGDDRAGKLIRKTMKNLNVSTKFLQGKLGIYFEFSYLRQLCPDMCPPHKKHIKFWSIF